MYTSVNLNSSPIFKALDKALDPALCFLSPETGSQLLIVRYIGVGTLAIFVWELLNNILNDYKLLSRYRIGLPTVIYFISRVCSLGFVIITTVFQTAPVDLCYGLEKTLAVFFLLSVTSTSLLFFFRTRAVFNGNPWIVAVFAGLWLAVAAACSTVIIGIDGFNIGQTDYCIDGQVHPFLTAGIIVSLINNTFVFLAITWRLFCNSHAPHTVENGMRFLVFRHYLLMLFKAMSQEGQAYYLLLVSFPYLCLVLNWLTGCLFYRATITVSLVTVITLFHPSIPDIIRTVLAIPNVILMHIMACRVFRNTIFKRYREGRTLISRDLRIVMPLSIWEGESGHMEESHLSPLMTTQSPQRVSHRLHENHSSR